VGFEGGHAKKYGFKEGGSRKNMVCKERVTKKIPSSLVVTASVIMQTSVPEGQKWRFLGSENSNFAGGKCPRTPLLYYTPNGNSTPPTVSLENTSRGMPTLVWPLLV